MSLPKTVRKRRRSLVRFLASCVPTFLWEYIFPVPPRMYISSNLIQKISGLRENNFPSDSCSSFCSFKQNFHNRNQELVLNSTPKKVTDPDDDRLKVLQEELFEIKTIVAKLLERQVDQYSGCGTLSNHSDQMQKSFVQPPPPPPPLPPPNFSLLPVNTPIKIEKKSFVPNERNGFPSGKELLRDLQKVQLKKIEKSPGGGPLKKPNKSVNDPGEFLVTVLKKRFGCVQISPDSSLESIGAENSFGSRTVNSSYEIGKNTKITVS